jgi:hypothetical protein
MKKIVAAIFLTCLFHGLQAQQDSSCNIRISLLTCSPGEDLYSIWGHSALRVTDHSANADIIYNYGTFDFDDPAFYSKFTRGKLLYFVSVQRFEDFLEEYQYYQRGITEQLLDLSCSEKVKLASALKENAKEENKYYRYDFTVDNCTTRLRDIVFKNADAPVITTDIRPKRKTTFRNLIHEYLDSSYQYWSKFGIDILLGMPLDKNLTNDETMFLPDYLLRGFDSSTVGGKRLVSEKHEILQPTLPKPKNTLLSPFAVFTILFLVIVVLSFFRNAEKFLSVFDFILFFLSGALGLFLLFMWFGTDHPECKDNLNLVWALPSHFIVIFFLFGKWNPAVTGWLKYYFFINSILLLLLLIVWHWLPQEMNNALLPVMCLLLIRSYAQYTRSREAGRRGSATIQK